MVFRFDSFEAYSDVYGRHAADECLRKVAHAITGSLRRAGDLTARYADDRFVVLMGEADAVQAAQLAERIAARVRGLAIHHPRSAGDRFVTVSYGVASVVPETGHVRPDLIGLAEQDMCGNRAAAANLTAL
jgi:diguanylate cyclase (GGDEF)-like protein